MIRQSYLDILRFVFEMSPKNNIVYDVLILRLQHNPD